MALPPWFLALPPKAARPTNHDFQENLWFVGLATPGPQKIIGPDSMGLLLFFVGRACVVLCASKAAVRGSGE